MDNLRLPTMVLVGGGATIGLATMAYKAYGWFTGSNTAADRNDKHIEKIFTRSKSAPSNLTSQFTSNDQTSNINPMTIQLLYRMENKFFKGIDKKACLDTKQMSILRTTASVLLSPEFAKDEAESLYDILFKLREREYLKPGFYKMNILQVLNTARIMVSDDVRKYLDLLEETIDEILLRDSVKEEKRIDAVIVCTDDDHSIAASFCKAVQENLTDVPDLELTLYDELDLNMTELRSMEDLFDRCNYLFILVTKTLQKDDLRRYLVEMGLIGCLEHPEPHLRWRVVPIWMDKCTKGSQHCPCELSPLKGVRYWYCLDNASDENKRRCFEHIKKLIVEGRKKLKRVQSVP